MRVRRKTTCIEKNPSTFLQRDGVLLLRVFVDLRAIRSGGVHFAFSTVLTAEAPLLAGREPARGAVCAADHAGLFRFFRAMLDVPARNRREELLDLSDTPFLVVDRCAETPDSLEITF